MAELANPNSSLTVPADLLHRQITTVFETWGMSPADADIAATVMVDTDLSGVDSHGIGMLPHYHKLLTDGRLDPRAVPVTVRDNGPVVLIDAKHGIGHVASRAAMRAAMDKAREHGIGVAGVTGSNHYGAAGWYARMAADDGLVAFSMTNVTNHFLVPVRGTAPALGTNPIAFAVPTHDPARPVLLDMATTTVAFGKVNIARRSQKPIPAGWALDDHGDPETDSQTAYEGRRLAPLGGTRDLGAHKGYGLALMVEILCATLTGASLKNLDTGHFFLVLDPSAFRNRDDFESDLDDLLGRMRAVAPSAPDQPVLIPGDPSTTRSISAAGAAFPWCRRWWMRCGSSVRRAEPLSSSTVRPARSIQAAGRRCCPARPIAIRTVLDDWEPCHGPNCWARYFSIEGPHSLDPPASLNMAWPS